ncbi:hypothetical protein HMN09_01424100 [Mycena chlorophos]|uniref:F-box domain-containing protein n=1 Tax=Mycena chlorophos TaxID=658473 RepID=A0A8H6RUM0_MYCCL|nr:hypothetical protein HMN09_01424100 [Mycena chlorophos]
MRKLLRHALRLVEIIQMASLREITHELTLKYRDEYEKWFGDLMELFPDENVTPTFHQGGHIGINLEKLGPAHSRGAQFYERFIYLIHQVKTNSKPNGQMDGTFLRSLARQANLLALLEHDETVRAVASQAVDAFTKAAEYEQQRDAGHALAASYGLGILFAGSKPVVGLIDPLHNHLVYEYHTQKKKVAAMDVDSEPSYEARRVDKIRIDYTQYSRRGLGARDGDSNIVFDDGAGIQLGVIQDIIQRPDAIGNRGWCTYLIVRRFSRLAEALDMFQQYAKKERVPLEITGWLCREEPNVDKFVIEPSHLKGHFARKPHKKVVAGVSRAFTHVRPLVKGDPTLNRVAIGRSRRRMDTLYHVGNLLSCIHDLLDDPDKPSGDSILPNEIWVEIFQIYSDAGRNEFTPLRAVSSHWNHLISTTSSLWSTVRYAQLPLDEYEDAAMRATFDGIMATSAPFNVVMESSVELEESTEALVHLWTMANQWTSISGFSWLDFVEASPHMQLAIPLDRLVAVDIAADYCVEEDDSLEIFANAPALVNASLRIPLHKIILPWGQLTSLHLSELFVSQCVKIITETSLVSDLTLTKLLYSSAISALESDVSVLTCASVRSLAWDLTANANSEVVDSFRFPRLEVFAVTGHSQHIIVSPTSTRTSALELELTDVMNRDMFVPWTTLTTLELHQVDNAEDVITVGSRLVSIETLRVHCSSLSPWNISWDILAPLASPDLFPALLELEFDDRYCCADFEAAIIYFLEERAGKAMQNFVFKCSRLGLKREALLWEKMQSCRGSCRVLLHTYDV